VTDFCSQVISSSVLLRFLVVRQELCWTAQVNQQEEPLVIDLRAAQLRVPAADVQAWASERAVFVSSLITDLHEARRAVRGAIIEFGAQPRMFEYDLGGQDVAADRAYIEGVQTSDIYVGIFGERYGVPLQSGYSATDAEYREAQKDGLRMALFVQDIVQLDGRQSDLAGGMRNAYTTSPWVDPDDLAERVLARLNQIASEELAPWVRLGKLVFRAREVRNSGQDATIVADIRSPAIHAALQDMVDRRESDLRLVLPGLVGKAQVLGLESQTQTSSAHRDTVQLRVSPAGQDSATFSSYSTGGRTWTAEELAGSALSDALFGTSLSPSGMFGSAKMADPLEPLRSLSLPDSVIRPVARILITEALVRSGAARIVDAFRMGPRHGDVRQLSVTWTPRRQYQNVAVEPVTTAGEISGL